MSMPRALALLTVLTAGVAAWAAPTPASAASRVLSYHCEASGVPVEQDGGIATASWDTPVGDNLVIDVGDEVYLTPLAGTLTLPAEFVDRLREVGFTDLSGDGGITMAVEETGADVAPVFGLGPVPVPESGPVTLEVTGQLDFMLSGTTDPVAFREAGTHTLVVVRFGITFGQGTDRPQAGLICQLQDTEDTAVDRFLVRAPAEPTPTVSPTSEPVRPVVVQTDFAE